MRVYRIIFIALIALSLTNCSLQNDDSPTAALKTFAEAMQKKDVQVIKSTISAGSLKMFEESAQKQNTTLDEILKKNGGAGLKQIPEMRGEKIEGDRATVEVKNGATPDWDKIPLVKEDGKWKIALDEVLSDVLNRTK